MAKGVILDVNKIEVTDKKRSNFNTKTNNQKNQNKNVKQRKKRHNSIQSGCGYLQFVTLKTLFIDLVVQLGDLGSDFAQGYTLIINEELFLYGIATYAIHWVIFFFFLNFSKPSRDLFLFFERCLVLLLQFTVFQQKEKSMESSRF